MNLTEIVKAVQNGDTVVFEKLYNECARSVYFIAFKIVGNKENAEEITQDVFLTVHKKISELNDPQAFPLWLKRITANKCTDFLRKNNPFTSDLEKIAENEFIEEIDPNLIPEESFDKIETAQILTKIIDTLPLPQKVCVYYYYYGQLSIKEIAKLLSIKETTVKNRLALARDKIRKKLEELEKDEGLKLCAVFPILIVLTLKLNADNIELPQSTVTKISNVIKSAVTTSTLATITTHTAPHAMTAKKSATIAVKPD